MKRRNKYLLIPLLSFLCLNNVYASCTQEEIANFKKVEDKYTVTYEFDKTTKTYTLYLNNPDIETYTYITEVGEEDDISVIDNKTIKIINVKPGEYEISVTGNNLTCDNILKKNTVDLQKYNEYSEDPLCEGIEEFVLCQEFYDKDIDYETFKSRVETYKKTKENQNDMENKDSDKKNERTNEILNKILNYIKNNLTSIIVLTIFVILIIISSILTIKSIRKSRRLE